MRKWLIELRKGYTQTQIAEAVGITQQMYSFIELGERRPSVEVAKKIASVLGFNWTRFFEDEDEITKTTQNLRIAATLALNAVEEHLAGANIDWCDVAKVLREALDERREDDAEKANAKTGQPERLHTATSDGVSGRNQRRKS